MSWSELERLVEEAETDAVIRRSLRHCRSRDELVLASRRLGYRITGQDIVRAWRLHRREQPMPAQDRPRQAGEAAQPSAEPARSLSAGDAIVAG